jgi:UDP-N-acetylmuramoyl-tripeptide--D-alanyl-D-alanine ligase
VYNALAAITVGLEFGVEFSDIKNALKHFDAFEKRMQVITLQDNIVILDDTYNANPASCSAAIDTLVDMNSKHGRKHVVLGDMLELGKYSEEEHQKLGHLIAEKHLDGIWGFGDAMKHATNAASKQGVSIARHLDSKEELLNSLIETIVPGDQVLVKGSRAMHMEDVVEGLKRRFDQVK